MEWPLTAERLVEATGDEYLERAEKLDMIFERISNTDALSRWVHYRQYRSHHIGQRARAA
jgi:hypothetical protein